MATNTWFLLSSKSCPVPWKIWNVTPHYGDQCSSAGSPPCHHHILAKVTATVWSPIFSKVNRSQLRNQRQPGRWQYQEAWSLPKGIFQKPLCWKTRIPSAPTSWSPCPEASPQPSPDFPWTFPPNHTLCLARVLRADPPCVLSTKHQGIPGLCNFPIHYFKMFFDKWTSTEGFFFLDCERKLPLSPYLSEIPLPCFFHLAFCFAQATQKGGCWVWDNAPARRRMRTKRSEYPAPNPDSQQPCGVQTLKMARLLVSWLSLCLPAGT